MKKMKNGLGKLICGGIILFSLCGCTSVVQKKSSAADSPALLGLLNGDAILGHRITDAELPVEDLNRITPEMARFAEQAVRGSDSLFDKVKALHLALLAKAPAGRGISYSAHTTENPVATFEQGRANCLSFSLLYVALARHLGIPAFVNEVQIPPSWSLDGGDKLYFMRHVNVKVHLPATHFGRATGANYAVVDLEMGRYRATYPQHYIEENVVAAGFYSNRAVELAAAGNRRLGYLYMVKALRESDQSSYLWGNLASFFLHEQRYSEAELAFLHGLSLKPDDFTIMNNLVSLYKKKGDPSKAETYRKLALSYRQTNPYYHYNVALVAMDQGDYQAAIQAANSAIKYKPEDARFHQLIIEINERKGNQSTAERLRKKYQLLVASKQIM